MIVFDSFTLNTNEWVDDNLQGLFIFRVLLASAEELSELENARSSLSTKQSGSRLVCRTETRAVDFNDIDSGTGTGADPQMQAQELKMSLLATRSLEQRAVNGLLELLESTRRKLPTSLTADWEELQMLQNSAVSEKNSSSAKLELALIYRVTKKRILEIAIQRLQRLVTCLGSRVDKPVLDELHRNTVDELARQIWLAPAFLMDSLARHSQPKPLSDEQSGPVASLRQYLVEIARLST